MSIDLIKNFVRKNIISIASVIVAIISIAGSALYVYFNKCEVVNDCSSSIAYAETSDEELSGETPLMISVDVKGSVKNPGVYSLEENSTVLDAINAAGGVSSKGVTTNINLSKRLTDEMVVYVFSKAEIKSQESSNQIVCEIPKCECETVTVTETIDTCSSSSTTTSSTTSGASSNSSSGTTSSSGSTANSNASSTSSSTTAAGSSNSTITTSTGTTLNKKININTATAEELVTLDGIGEAKAKSIIEYRTQNGNFKTIEDITNVSGIGTAAFEKIKDYITV